MKMARASIAVILAVACWPLAGCEIGMLIGGAAQNFEYQKTVEVLPQYRGLEDKKVAVLVNADPVTLYEHPLLLRQVAGGLSVELNAYVPGIQVVSPDAVLAWQFNTAEWSALPYGDLVRALDVDRVVYVDLYEYRLHPPGDSYIWQGVCAATIGIIEQESIDPDFFAETMDVMVEFPTRSHVTRDELPARDMQTILVKLFIRDSGFLFYRHVKPKYPDKYQGEWPKQTRASR